MSAARSATQAHGTRDALVTGAALAALLLWDLSGLDMPAAHDHLFHTVLTLLDVKTTLHEAAWDLAQGCRLPPPRP